MHLIAEQGIAAHWRYKGTERDKKFDRRINWLKQLLEWKRDSKTAKEFVESLKIDLFENEIVVFTPKGDPISLPENSTPVDFAYEIHTNIGATCSQAEVNGKIVPLDHILKSGDIVHIITKRNARPNRNWLSFVKTTKARSKIRLDLDIRTDFEKKRLFSEDAPKSIVEQIEILTISGKGHPLKLSKCCLPKYGEPIIAYLTKDNKVTIHRKDCPNIHALQNARHVPMRWKQSEVDTIKVRVTVDDKPGVLAELLNLIAQRGINVHSIFTRSKRERVVITILLNTHPNVKSERDLIGELVLQVRSLKEVLDVRLLT